MEWPIYFAWMALALAVQLGCGLTFPRRLGRGLITRAWQRLPFFGGRPYDVRMKQIFFFLALFITLSLTVWASAMIGYWCTIIVLYLDDYLFGDDDNWRRRWEAVRNKVRWKMRLPAMKPSAGGTG